MEEKPEIGPEVAPEAPESPRPFAFTVDFGNDKKVDLQRHKSLAEKFQQRHKRGKSMSKLEGGAPTGPATNAKKHPLTGNLPRKSSFQSEDERPERCKSANVTSNVRNKRTDLTLPLENVTTDRMTHSFPNADLLSSLTSPCDIQNVSSPEFELISPFTPGSLEDVVRNVNNISLSSDDVNKELNFNLQEVDVDKKSDTISETGTYTLEIDNYSEEQKARMSIDNEFKIEKISVEEKTEEYIRSLTTGRFVAEDIFSSSISSQISGSSSTSLQSSFSTGQPIPPVPPLKPQELVLLKSSELSAKKVLSPILSPTQNISIVEDAIRMVVPPSPPKKPVDSGTIISVTSSGAFRSKNEEKKRMERRLSLTKSEVHVEAYIDGKIYNEDTLNNSSVKASSNKKSKLTANLVNVQSIEVNNLAESGNVVSASLIFGKSSNVATVTTGLPPTPTGKTSPSKIPSPIHTLSRPRSRNSLSALPDDFDTDSILKPTRNYINSLQQKLSLDSDQDSDYDAKYGLQLNNTAHLLKQKALHIRHNSLDDRTINNKLEHFQTKNLQPIDQTYTNVFSQYPRQNKVVNKINNSPSNSPIRRSNSFSNRNQMNNNGMKSTNIVMQQKETNLCSSPSYNRNDRIQRSSSTASIKPNYGVGSRLSALEHKKIDRSQFGDTESSSEEDLEAKVQKKKDLGNLSNTRCNRTFSLRRARVDNEANKLKCPNTPDMRRKTFQPVGVKPERAISVDRKPVKTNEVQSRYLLSLNKRTTPVRDTPKPAAIKPNPQQVAPTKAIAARPSSAAFARTDSGRFSMRAPKSPAVNQIKGPKKDKNAKQGGGRSNSSLSSREVEFQNWKRRKSYDPMKAAAEGKRKEIEKKLGGMGGTAAKQGVPSPDSSPSHSGSVHRSQSFHGTAALEQLISSEEEEEEEDITFSADEGFSPPTPSPCELSPTKVSLRHTLWDRIRN